MNKSEQYEMLDILLETALHGMARLPNSEHFLNWYSGRASGSIQAAYFLDVIPVEVRGLLDDMVGGWYDYYNDKRIEKMLNGEES